MKLARFARTFCRNIGTFGANLWELFPDLRIRHSKIGQETLKVGARTNRFDCKTSFLFTLSEPSFAERCSVVLCHLNSNADIP